MRVNLKEIDKTTVGGIKYFMSHCLFNIKYRNQPRKILKNKAGQKKQVLFNFFFWMNKSVRVMPMEQTVLKSASQIVVEPITLTTE